jgi:3,2-trans-enoyl-CoA isomerase
MLSITKLKNIKLIRFNSKPVNALTTELMQEFLTELQAIKNSSTTGLLLASSLPKVFSAGLDLKTLVAHPEFYLNGDGTKDTHTRREAYEKHIKSYMKLFSDCVFSLLTLPQPTVALIKGHAPAGGTVLSLACDFRLGSSAGFAMGLNEVQVGMAPPMWVHRLVLNAMGSRRSILAMQKGTIYDKDECLKFGLVDEIVNDNELINAGVHTVEEYMKLPPVARADAKLKSIQNITSQFTEEALNSVVSSISGPEFQLTVKEILDKLSKK